MNIFLTQDYSAIPTWIRWNSSIIVCLAMDSYPKLMCEELYQEDPKKFQKFYEDNVNKKKDHSFIIVDRSAQIEYRFILCKGGKSSEYVVL